MAFNGEMWLDFPNNRKINELNAGEENTAVKMSLHPGLLSINAYIWLQTPLPLPASLPLFLPFWTSLFHIHWFGFCFALDTATHSVLFSFKSSSTSCFSCYDLSTSTDSLLLLEFHQFFSVFFSPSTDLCLTVMETQCTYILFSFL